MTWLPFRHKAHIVRKGIFAAQLLAATTTTTTTKASFLVALSSLSASGSFRPLLNLVQLEIEGEFGRGREKGKWTKRESYLRAHVGENNTNFLPKFLLSVSLHAKIHLYTSENGFTSVIDRRDSFAWRVVSPLITRKFLNRRLEYRIQLVENYLRKGEVW